MVDWSRQMLYSGFYILPRSVVRSAYSIDRSDNLDVITLGQSYMKWLLIAFLALAGLIAYDVAHPYMNGVAYTHQRECESSALRTIAYEISEHAYEDGDDTKPLTIAQIVATAPKPTGIDNSRFGVTMTWDIEDRDSYQIGSIDKTILLFPDTLPSAISDSRTPLIAHVSSSFTKKNDNCVLLVMANTEILTLSLTNDEFGELLACERPEDGARWVKSN